MTKNISERMKALETAVPGQAQVQTPNTTTPKIATNPSQTDTDLTINLREIRAEQLRIANQLDKISEQNKQILLKIK